MLGFFFFWLQGLLPVKQLFQGSLRTSSIALLIIFYSISFGWEISPVNVDIFPCDISSDFWNIFTCPCSVYFLQHSLSMQLLWTVDVVPGAVFENWKWRLALCQHVLYVSTWQPKLLSSQDSRWAAGIPPSVCTRFIAICCLLFPIHYQKSEFMETNDQKIVK